MRSIHQNGAPARHVLSTLSNALRRHRAITRVSLATLSLGVALAASLQGAAAGPEPTPTTARSILPEVVGTGVATDQSILISFDHAMNPASVTDALRLRPASGWVASWSDDGTELRLAPSLRWRTDARYVATIGATARTAAGRAMGESRTFSFTTETAPVVTDFQLYYVEESQADRARAGAEASLLEASGSAPVVAADTSSDVSAGTRVTIGFSTPMSQADVERAFVISPSVRGSLSWSGNQLVFVPRQRLEPGARYAISLVGARDVRGNRLGGDLAFSFTTRKGAQVVKVAPRDGAKNVDPDEIHLWFSQPMDVASVRSALRVEAPSGRAIRGKLSWNDAGTQLRFTFHDPLNEGRTFRIQLGKGARDADGNAVTGGWRFRTKAPPVVQLAQPVGPTDLAAPAPPPPPPPTGGPNAPSDVLEYALWQINQSRADYGFAPLRLDAAISQVAADHAWDMLRYNYFDHTGRDGSRVADRLRRAGIGFSWSGENICYYNGIGVRATLDWCHRTFMAEPYPGYFNHIANILNPRYTRVGVGIAQSGGAVKIVWDFAG